LPWLNAIRFCRQRLFYRATSSGQVDWFLGPEVRGSIGHQLKSYMGCSRDQNEDCVECPEQRKGDCLYAAFYVDGFNKSKGLILPGCCPKPLAITSRVMLAESSLVLMNISHLRCGPVGVRFIEPAMTGVINAAPTRA
jgi:hypothetical protein